MVKKIETNECSRGIRKPAFAVLAFRGVLQMGVIGIAIAMVSDWVIRAENVTFLMKDGLITYV
ncbi:MAG: hypothetical protein Q4C91_22925 [Eubacteriales bacterium]|nr:hypothetical protein [Eubacteriales bacterium]